MRPDVKMSDAVLGIAPHSLRAVDAPELAALLKNWNAGPVHIHAAEQTRQARVQRPRVKTRDFPEQAPIQPALLQAPD